MAHSPYDTPAPKARAHQPLTHEQMRHCLESLRSDFDNANIIYQRRNRVVIRWRNEQSDETLIIKLWSRLDQRGMLRALMRIAHCDLEWRILKRLHGVNMSVPYPLGRCGISPHINGYTEALFTEDLGECEIATSYLKRLIATGQEQQVLELENNLIEMARQLLDAGIVDVDHGLVNTVVQDSGRLVRLDFELARHVIWPRLFTNKCGQMLGRLIVLHAFAVQPDVDRTTRFAERLRDRLNPSRRILARAGEYIHDLLQEQHRNTGIHTRLVLPWN